MPETHVWVTDHRTGHQYPTPKSYADSLPDDLTQHPDHAVRDATGVLLDPILNTGEQPDDQQPEPDGPPQPTTYTGFANPTEPEEA